MLTKRTPIDDHEERLRAWTESFEERAAILEYEGGLERAEAERRALEMVGPPPSKGRVYS